MVKIQHGTVCYLLILIVMIAMAILIHMYVGAKTNDIAQEAINRLERELNDVVVRPEAFSKKRLKELDERFEEDLLSHEEHVEYLRLSCESIFEGKNNEYVKALTSMRKKISIITFYAKQCSKCDEKLKYFISLSKKYNFDLIVLQPHQLKYFVLEEDVDDDTVEIKSLIHAYDSKENVSNFSKNGQFAVLAYNKLTKHMWPIGNTVDMNSECKVKSEIAKNIKLLN